MAVTLLGFFGGMWDIEVKVYLIGYLDRREYRIFRSDKRYIELQNRESKSLDVAFNIAGVERIRSEILRLRSMLEAI